MLVRFAILLAYLAGSALAISGQPSGFIYVRGHQLYANRKPYYFVGANYWYGSLLGLEKDPKRGIERLRRELDLLKSNGVTNLRLMAGAEGSGLMNGVTRVGPPIQPMQSKFDERALEGLDQVLAEMGKRNMRAVIFLSNNWEWSGGFQQYLIWNNVISSEWLTKKPSWDELRDNVAKFYSCAPCKNAYDRQARSVITRKNRVTGKKYVDDPTIMAWELANEPRPMRPFANDDYRQWIIDTARLIRSLDGKHLITTGHEGWIGTQDIGLYEAVHADKNIDYLTIHIWPKNWGWFAPGKMEEDLDNTERETIKYISENLAIAEKLDKPMVIEEFGLPRDGEAFDNASSTRLRDIYYARILSFVGGRPGGEKFIAGANFWAFGGTAKPIAGQPYWKKGDEYSGDPPMEEQGLNSVFAIDSSTLKVIRQAARNIGAK